MFPNSIGLYWTDEELIMLLLRMVKGAPFPNNVIEDVNPYHYKPSNVPEDFWFYIRSDQKKDTENGLWKAKHEPFEVFSNSSVTGLRTTLEFYEGSQRTNWVMQEYSVTQKDLQNSNCFKGSKLLCRVFLTNETIEIKTVQQKVDIAKGAEIDSSSKLSSSQDLIAMDSIARGDYLELDDLLNPLSSPSFGSESSDVTSCMTLSSDECFDSLELLKDIEDEINKGKEVKSVDFKYSRAASAKPDDVVIHDLSLGSIIGTSSSEAVEKRGRDKIVAENAFKTENGKKGERKRSTQNSADDTSSPSSHKSAQQGESNKSVRSLKKLKRKYLCFMPF